MDVPVGCTIRGFARAVFVCTGILWSTALSAQTIVGSKHDLRDPRGTNETCVFCHIPHLAGAGGEAPLWNRKLGPVAFTPYTSPTMDTECPATPSPASQACLSCHDGVNANMDKHRLLVSPRGDSPDTSSSPNCSRCHPERFRLGPKITWTGTDLRNDHPISMTYPTPAQDPTFVTPPDSQTGWLDVKLFAGKVECPTCHNVHNPSIRPFLRKSMAGDALCLTCHIK